MRVCIAVVAVAVLAAAGCGGHGSTTAACRLDRGPDVAERTGEHTLVLIVSGCSVRATPRVELFDARGRRLLFAVVPVGGRAGNPTYSPLPALLRRAAARACATALAGIPPGAPRQAVYAAFGKASFPGPQCPAWRWPPGSGALDGARVCFARDRATAVQAAVHG